MSEIDATPLIVIVASSIYVGAYLMRRVRDHSIDPRRDIVMVGLIVLVVVGVGALWSYASEPVFRLLSGLFVLGLGVYGVILREEDQTRRIAAWLLLVGGSLLTLDGLLGILIP